MNMNMTTPVYGLLTCVLASSLFLSGCGSNQEERELRGYINQLKTQAAIKEVKSKTVVWQLPKAVTYGPDKSQTDSRTMATKGTSNPLQVYPVTSLQFVGILTENNQISAYVMTPDNMLYLVKVGDIIGEEYGKIVKIDSDHIEISEKVMNGNQPAERKVKMELKDSPQ